VHGPGPRWHAWVHVLTCVSVRMRGRKSVWDRTARACARVAVLLAAVALAASCDPAPEPLRTELIAAANAPDGGVLVLVEECMDDPAVEIAIDKINPTRSPRTELVWEATADDASDVEPKPSNGPREFVLFEAPPGWSEGVAPEVRTLESSYEYDVWIKTRSGDDAAVRISAGLLSELGDGEVLTEFSSEPRAVSVGDYEERARKSCG